MSDEFETKSTEVSDESAGDEQSVEDGMVVAEKKKQMTPGMLIVLGLLLIGVAGIFAMYKRNSPAAAAASVDNSAQQTIDSFLSSRQNGVQMMQSMLRDTEKLVQQFLSYPAAAQVPLSELHTNPFRTHATTDASDDGDSTNKKKREAERLSVIKSVQELQLQSIIHSETRRACMIDNTLYTEGQQVELFTIEKISPKAVVLKSGAYRFELKMDK